MSNRTNESDIAVIGMSGRFPGSHNVEEFWELLKNGEEGVSFFSEQELEAKDEPGASHGHQVRAHGVVEGIDLFDAGFFGYSPREAEVMDPQQRLFLECAHEALENAGYDPAQHRALIGVYAGMSMNSYLMNVSSDAQTALSLGHFQTLLLNDRDFLTTHVSYKLNLKGPSVVVQTSCSTSLVAVHLACQGLIGGDCDMALAGGVSIAVPQKKAHWYEEGGILSPDGHCRAFDARGLGTVGGSGLGIVVLKRLEEAIADRDSILAVIRGSAINNDGAAKVGYTAPGVEGQAQVIASALAVAGVECETLDYIEAHGTGTPLGDPVEIAALNRVFRSATSKRGFCRIGSVKTNIGHLDAAAGIAGLIKTVLALWRKQLPPSLHFERPNPKINFEESPFYVQTRLEAWEGRRRRAGVSSFGIGGTNAHVVLEEAPEVEGSGESRPVQLLVLSARSEEALQAAGGRLAGHLRGDQGQDLADIAYTCQVGRKAFKYRRAIVCADRAEAIEALEGVGGKQAWVAQGESRQRAVAFLFPGQGSQYAGMGSELYAREGVFRAEVDRCAEMLREALGLDLREVMFARGASAEEELSQTRLTQPALFVIEYALSRLWEAWGVKAEALLGHSVGEYVAACIAGVFTLEEGLGLVAARGRLMQELPGGAMLAVGLSEVELAVRLGEGLSLAAVNEERACVVSGSRERVERMEEELRSERVMAVRLATSHAFHSEMMEPAMEEFREKVSGVRLKPPRVRCVSNVTGGWLSVEEATSVEYWVEQARGTVRFAAGLEELLKEPGRALVEVGPGEALSRMARRRSGEGVVTVSTLRGGVERGEGEQEAMIKAVGRLWVWGVEVDWHGYHEGERRGRVPLPTYPFERRRYWIDRKDWVSAASAGAPTAGPARRALSVSVDSNGALPATAEHGQDGASKRGHSRPPVEADYASPRNEIERAIADIWEEVLGIEPIGIHDNFFELGGHSLLAIQVISRIRDVFDVEMPANSLFEAQTISHLAVSIVQKEVERFPGELTELLAELE